MYLSIAYLLSWLIVIFLTTLQFSDSIERFPIELLIFIVLGAILLVLSEFILSKRHIKKYSNSLPGSISTKLLLFAFVILAFGTMLIEQFKLPVIALFGFEGQRYNEYGIRGLQGFINAIYLAVMTILFYRLLIGQSVISRLFFFLLLLYPILLISRQVLVILALQMFLVWYIFYPEKKITKSIKTLVFGFLSVFVFGLLGDYRVEAEADYTSRELLNSMIDLSGVSESVPTPLLWFYIYFASPSTNLILNIEYGSCSMDILKYFSSLLPSPVRVALGFDSGFEGYDSVILVSPNLNMGTAFLPAYKAMGWSGLIMHYFVLFFVSVFFILKKNKNIYFYFGYISLIPILFFTVFANLIFYLPVMFQLVIFALLGTFSKKRLCNPMPSSKITRVKSRVFS